MKELEPRAKYKLNSFWLWLFTHKSGVRSLFRKRSLFVGMILLGIVATGFQIERAGLAISGLLAALMLALSLSWASILTSLLASSEYRDFIGAEIEKVRDILNGKQFVLLTIGVALFAWTIASFAPYELGVYVPIGVISVLNAIGRFLLLSLGILALVQSWELISFTNQLYIAVIEIAWKKESAKQALIAEITDKQKTEH